MIGMLTKSRAVPDAGFTPHGSAGTSTAAKSAALSNGAETKFAIGCCSLGSVLVAASSAGVCAILLGDGPEELTRALHSRLPGAEPAGGDPGLAGTLAKILEFVETPRMGLDLPLDMCGTPFQQRVWTALRDIPPGSTASYGEIAVRIGAPKAVRAVAGACAANLIAVAIPCHRVVRGDGAISGYRWGVERKRALLERETARSVL